MPGSELVQDAVSEMLIADSAWPEIEAFIDRQPLCEE